MSLSIKNVKKLSNIASNQLPKIKCAINNTKPLNNLVDSVNNKFDKKSITADTFQKTIQNNVKKIRKPRMLSIKLPKIQKMI